MSAFSLNFEKYALAYFSLGGLAGIVASAVVASFIFSKELADLDKVRHELTDLKMEVVFLECRERDISSAQQHMVAAIEHIATITDRPPEDIVVRRTPQIVKLRELVSQTNC